MVKPSFEWPSWKFRVPRRCRREHGAPNPLICFRRSVYELSPSYWEVTGRADTRRRWTRRGSVKRAGCELCEISAEFPQGSRAFLPPTDPFLSKVGGRREIGERNGSLVPFCGNWSSETTTCSKVSSLHRRGRILSVVCL